MDWLKKIWERIVESDNQKYIDEIKELQKMLNESNKKGAEHAIEADRLFDELTETNHLLAEKIFEINKFKKNKFEQAKTQFKEKPTKYKWRPNKNTFLRHSLSKFGDDTVYINKYWDFLVSKGIKTNYDSIDTLVYKVVSRVQRYINRELPDDYKTDKEVFGVNEYWLTPQEAYDYYVTKKKAIDCDDTSAFLYGCIVSALIKLNYNFDKRIYRVDIDFPGGHALVAYLKDNGVWAGIESTYGEERFSKNWFRDKDIFTGIYTGVWHIFDEDSEYELIHPYQRK